MNEAQTGTTDGDVGMAPLPRRDDRAETATQPSMETDRSARPAGVPEKFWDPEAGRLRADALLKSYLELERRLGSSISLPTDEMDTEGQARLRRVLGVPDEPDGYQIQSRHELIQPDPGINAKLHEAGFSPSQAQLVYDLAAEHLVPVIDQSVAELEANRESERLAAHFGGDHAWRTLARQIKTWGQANLAEDVFQTLAASYEGVLAMHQMMRGREPDVIRDGSGTKPEVDEATLAEMMRDPRYWRDRNPTLVAKVTEGFQRLYPS